MKSFNLENSRYKLIIISIIAIILAILSYSTFTSMIDKEDISDTQKIGSLDFKVIQKDSNGNTVDINDIDIMPGDIYDGNLSILNISNQPFYVRVKIDKRVEDDLNDDVIDINYKNDHWKYRNGYYYYEDSLNINEKTEPLFDKIHFSKDMNNEYMNKKVYLDITVECIQSRNNSTSPLSAFGWSIE